MYRISINPEEIEKMPIGSFPGEIHVISQPGVEFAKAILYLSRQKMIGFDTETRPVFSPNQKHSGTALLQLSGPDKAYLFRVQTLGMNKMLCGLLSNKNIIKVGAAVHDDIRGLQHMSPFEARNFVDLQKIVWEWGIKDKSVKKMAAIILGCKISKAQQLSNWEADELSPGQQLYAATDAWICREMYLKLLGSEKNPLSHEQLNPPQPQPKPESEQSASVQDKPKEAIKPKKKRRRKSTKKKDGQDNTQEG